MANDPSPIVTTPDYSGLQTVDDPGLEVHPQHGLYCPYPEVNTVAEKAPEAAYPAAYPPAYSGAAQAEKYPLAAGAYAVPPGEAQLPPQNPAKYSRRCKLFSLIGVIALVIIAIVVGCVVGLVVVPGSKSANSDAASSTGSSSGGNSNGGSSGPSGSNNNNTIRSTCRNTVCPQILAATQHNNALMVFARGNDNNIWYNTAPATSLSPNWPSASSWQNLQGGPFLSQPAAQVWRPDNQSSLRVSVSAVGDPDRGARLRQLDTATSQWNNWKNLRGSVSSPISLCSVGEFRLDLWAASGGDINHNFHSGGAEDKYWAPDASPTWQGTTKFGEQRITARPGIACRWNLFGHDVVVIGEKGEMIHTRYSGPNGWVPPFVLDGGGKLTADPVVLATTNERLDFFAVGVDKAIYHASWSEEAGYSLLNSLGGSFQSVPSAVVTRSGRIDVVALATTDTLHHRVYQGGQWSEAWEDLGVVGNSAPLVANLTTSPESVAVFVLGTNGQLNQTSWKVSNDLSWKGLTWKGMGGDLTATYFKL